MASNRFSIKRGQNGATMVEMALTLPLFFILVFGLIEFALIIFTWSRGVEATRAGARYAIVNAPVATIPDCTGHAPDNQIPPSPPKTCGTGCDGLISRMQALYPELLPGNVNVTYACSFAGLASNPNRVMQVTVAINNQKYHLLVAGLLGFEPTLTLPEFATTRISEDLYTYTGP